MDAEGSRRHAGWLSHPIRHLQSAAKELACKDRMLKHLSLKPRFADDGSARDACEPAGALCFS